MKNHMNFAEYKQIVRSFCKEVNAELLFVNESDWSFGVQYTNGALAHIYPDELLEYLKERNKNR